MASENQITRYPDSNSLWQLNEQTAEEFYKKSPELLPALIQTTHNSLCREDHAILKEMTKEYRRATSKQEQPSMARVAKAVGLSEDYIHARFIDIPDPKQPISHLAKAFTVTLLTQDFTVEEYNSTIRRLLKKAEDADNLAVAQRLADQIGRATEGVFKDKAARKEIPEIMKIGDDVIEQILAAGSTEVEENREVKKSENDVEEIETDQTVTIKRKSIRRKRRPGSSSVTMRPKQNVIVEDITDAEFTEEQSRN